MPKRCTDPRCPINEYYSNITKSQRDFYKIHGKPTVTFAFDDARENHRERSRIGCYPRSNKAKDFREKPKRGRSHSRCCKNKKCQTSKCTTERSTSTNSRPKTRILNDDMTRYHVSKKSGKHFHRYKDRGKPCECCHNKYCKRKEETPSKRERRSSKGRRRYRSRRKRKKKYSWLRNCFLRLCICAKIPSSMELDMYAQSRATLHRNCECCCTYGDKYGEALKKSKNSRKHTFLVNDNIWRENNHLVQKCECMNSIVKSRTLPQDQSYLQGAFERGLNVMRRGINFCM